MKPVSPELPAVDAELLDVGAALGRNQTLSLLAGHCSAAHAATLRRLRKSKVYKRVAPDWRQFCARYLKISRAQTDHIIQLLDEFGPGYFELSQLTRISPETYRAIAPAVKDGALQFQGNAIELSLENSRQVAEAVAELRRALPRKKRPGPPEMHVRLRQLDERCTAMLEEFAEIARLEQCGENWLAFTSLLARVASALHRLEADCGVA